jgi:hypothetical protein
MHGVPVLLKDNIGTADQLNTTAESYAFYGSIVPRDSTVAANLRAAEYVILGQAGMSEWSFWRGVNNSNGRSARGGQMKGAYYFDRGELVLFFQTRVGFARRFLNHDGLLHLRSSGNPPMEPIDISYDDGSPPATTDQSPRGCLETC